MPKSIPVIMFHGVSEFPENYPKPELVLELQSFIEFLDYLKLKNFQTISLDELYDFKKGNRDFDNRPRIVLTFDDGFLDNYVFASVELEKRNFKGIIFCSTEFIDFTDSPIRPRYCDLSNSALQKEDYLNYCNINELKWLEAKGIMDVQGHSASHSWVYSDRTLVGLYKGTEVQPWLEWNKNIKMKPRQMTHLVREHSIGYPILKNAPSLQVAKRYFPDERYFEDMSKFIEKIGLSQLNIDLLQEQHKALMTKYPGSFETAEETESRFMYELCESKVKLERALEKRIEHFAWPNGGFCDESYRIARKTYKSFQMPSSKVKNLKKDPTQYYFRIGAPQSSRSNLERRYRLRKMILKIEISRGAWYKVPQFLKLKYILKKRFGTSISRNHKYNFDLISYNDHVIR